MARYRVRPVWKRETPQLNAQGEPVLTPLVCRQPLVWKDGPTPACTIEPGTVKDFNDAEVQAIEHHLVALDAEGQRVLSTARARVAAPADIDVGTPELRGWLARAVEDKTRLVGTMRDVVRQIIERGATPTRADLSAAFREDADQPLPSWLRDYIDEHYIRQVKPLTPGPKGRSVSTWGELLLRWVYHLRLEDARAANGGRVPRGRAAELKAQIAKALKMSPRTVERLLATRALDAPPPPRGRDSGVTPASPPRRRTRKP